MSFVIAAEAQQSTPDPYEVFLAIDQDGRSFYRAGLPGYLGNFTQDVTETGVIASKPHILRTQVVQSALHQGQKDDLITGEEPGKVHHEFPGVVAVYKGDREKLDTTYSGAATTAQFLTGAEALLHLEGEEEAMKFLTPYMDNFRRAAAYILRHVMPNGIFYDFPPGGGTLFALKTTYWKDSILSGPNGKEESKFPAAYGQLHFVAARGLLAAARLLKDGDLARTAEGMFMAGIPFFMRKDEYIIYHDAENTHAHPSSDELHAIAHIPAKYMEELPKDAIKKRAQTLATPFGYVCTPEEIARTMKDPYHAYSVWVYEQAKIYYASTKIKLGEVACTAQRVAPYIRQGQELFHIYRNGPCYVAVPGGNQQQFWSMGTKEFFADPIQAPLVRLQWL